MNEAEQKKLLAKFETNLTAMAASAMVVTVAIFRELKDELPAVNDATVATLTAAVIRAMAEG